MIFEEKVKNALEILPEPEVDDNNALLPSIDRTKSMPILESVKKVQSKIELSIKGSVTESKKKLHEPDTLDQNIPKYKRPVN